MYLHTLFKSNYVLQVLKYAHCHLNKIVLRVVTELLTDGAFGFPLFPGLDCNPPQTTTV